MSLAAVLAIDVVYKLSKFKVRKISSQNYKSHNNRICNSTLDDIDRFNVCKTTVVDLHEKPYFK